MNLHMTGKRKSFHFELNIVISEQKQRRIEIDQRCYEVMQKGHRKNTRRNIRSFAGQYSKFCGDLGVDEYPANEWQLARYACYTATHVTSIGTVENYVSGVRNLHRLAGYEVPPVTAPNLKLVMNGLKAELARPTKQAAPLNREILIEISQKVKWDSQFHVCCYSAILMSFYLCLRCSNLVPDSTPNFNPNEQLTRGHISLDEDLELAMVDVEWSKTLQHREKDLWLVMRPASRSDICLLATLQKLFKLVPADDTDPCFSYRNTKNVLEALTYAQLSKQLKEWVQATGRDPTKYTLHGMRRGSTMHTYHAGLDAESLCLIGDWCTDTYKRYIDVDLDKRVEAAVRFTEDM